MPGKRRAVHTEKWDRCIADVGRRRGVRSAAAVCTRALGERGSIRKGHRRKRARNPKPVSAWVIIATKGTRTRKGRLARPLFYDGTRFAAGRAQSAVRFPTRAAATAFAKGLKRQYPTALKRVRLRVSGV